MKCEFMLDAIIHWRPTAKQAQHNCGCEYYPDVVQTWLSKPISPTHIRRLGKLCGSHDHLEEAMRYNAKWIMRLQARQPTPGYFEALQKIEASQPIMINYVELARDECCTSRRVLEALYEHRREHELRLWHPKRQQARAYDDSRGNTYDASRKKARLLTRYMEPFSRITGECDCLHSEFRLMGVQSVRRAGIHSMQDLIDFNHEKWWRAKTRIITKPDFERLGRLIRNRRDNTRDRLPLMHVSRCSSHMFKFNGDARLGSAIMSGFENVQAFVDHFGGVSRLQQAGVFVSVGRPANARSNAKCDVCT